MDHLGTGYYVPVTARFEKKFPQHSRMQDTGKETKGDWVSLVVDHGKAPKGGSYEYAVLPQTSTATLQAFAKKPVMPTSYSLYRTISILMYCLKLHKRCFPADYCNGRILRAWL